MTALNMQFKRDGTGVVVDQALVNQFPLFHGKAPPGHPYPQAFTEGATDTRFCFVETVGDMTLLRRMLPSGRTINIDTMDFAMLNGGQGLAHINMNNIDNRVSNLSEANECFFGVFEKGVLDSFEVFAGAALARNRGPK